MRSVLCAHVNDLLQIPFAAVFLVRGFHSLLLYADKGDPSSAALPLDEGLAGAAMRWTVS